MKKTLSIITGMLLVFVSVILLGIDILIVSIGNFVREAIGENGFSRFTKKLANEISDVIGDYQNYYSNLIEKEGGKANGSEQD